MIYVIKQINYDFAISEVKGGKISEILKIRRITVQTIFITVLFLQYLNLL